MMTYVKYNHDVLIDTLPGKHGDVGLITLNRPHSINAINIAICQQLQYQLTEWAHHPNIKAVIIRGNGKRGFCAGGDIRYIYKKRHNLNEALLLFKHEYQVNYQIACFPKPVISLLHGITLGGGVGISIYSRYRIADDSLQFGMPETGIGFFPDIGASYFLSRCPHAIGCYLGLIGKIIHAREAKQLGFISHIIQAAHFDELIDRCCQVNSDTFTEHLNDLAKKPPTSATHSDLTVHQDTIAECFSQFSIEAIVKQLKAQKTHKLWAEITLTELLKRSPISLKVTLKQLHTGTHQTLKQCIMMEYLLVQSFLKGKDFFEGIRAAVIDKDHNPHWEYQAIEDIKPALIDSYFTQTSKQILIL